MKLKLTKNDAQEALHKMGILADEPDLQDDYQLTQHEADVILDTIPRNGGEWEVPAWAIEAVKGEMQDHAGVLRGIAADARSGAEIGQSLALHRQAGKFEKMFA
jgi:hypothetical protein